MQFANPSAFYWLAVLPLIFGLFLWSQSRWRRAVARFGDPALVERLTPSVSPWRDKLKSALFLAGIFFLVVALARPQWGQRTEEIVRSGVDVFVALDTSLSMDATDVVPSRLEKARRMAGALIEHLEGNRIGLIVFAGSAFVQCPLTLDYGAAQIFLDAVDTSVVPEPGTNIARALEAASRGFLAQESKYKVVLLITDGEQHEGDPLAAAEKAREAGIVIHALGVGTPGGDPIPVRNDRGEVEDYKRDPSGQPVLSRLDEDTLRRIALTTGGKYFRASERETEMDDIAELIDRMEGTELASQLFTRYEERFYWPLAVALAFLVSEAFLPRRRVLNKEAA